jgi:hypothetical protein
MGRGEEREGMSEQAERAPAVVEDSEDGEIRVEADGTGIVVTVVFKGGRKVGAWQRVLALPAVRPNPTNAARPPGRAAPGDAEWRWGEWVWSGPAAGAESR